MKNNIAVFILIILVASSFKYRSKTIGSAKPAPSENIALEVLSLPESEPKAEFESLITKMQDANRELAQGSPGKMKELWSRTDDVTIFCGSSGVELKGWKAVEERLDWQCSQVPNSSDYSFERVSSQVGENYGSLQQTEHYKSLDGKTIDLGVTLLFKKEASGWRIVHRHAENLSPRVASM